jgi:hypothetical protein
MGASGQAKSLLQRLEAARTDLPKSATPVPV